MKKYLSKGLGFLVLSLLLVGATPAFAVAPNWDVSGVSGINLNYLGTDYLHNVTLSENNISGAVTGSGVSGAYTWVVTSASVSGDNFSLTADYTATPDAVSPQTTLIMTGTISAGLISGTWNDNYNAGSRSGTFTTASGTAMALQTITFGALGPMTYGDADFVVSATGGASGNPVTFTSQTVSVCTVTGNTVHIVTVGTCTVRASQAGNMTYSAALDVDQSFTVNPKALTITGTTVTPKVYDKLNTASLVFTSPTLVGIVGSDNVTPVTGSAVGTFSILNVGTQPVTVSGITLTGAQAGNYTLTQPTGITGNITARPITVTAAFNSKQYDSLFTASALPTITLGSLAVGDTAVFSELYTNKNIGVANKTVVPNAVITDGNSGNNYAVTLVNNTVSTITSKVLNVAPSASDKVYNGNTVATLSFTDDRALGDNLTISGTGHFQDKNVDTGKVVVIGTVTKTGPDAGNYTLNVSGSLILADITSLPITITAQTDSKVYDGLLTSSLTPVFAPALAPGDSFTTLTQAYLNKDVGAGNKVIAPTAVINDGNGGLNYAITLVNNTVSTITAKALTLAGTTVTSKVYDKTLPATLNFAGASLVGLVSPDTGATVTFSGGTGVYNNSNVGTLKPVTVTGVTLGGSGAGNYTLTQPTGITGTITSRPITVTAAFNSKVYDGLLTAATLPSITSGNLVGGDTASFSEVYTNKNVGAVNKTVVPSAVVTDGNGGLNYAVTLVNNTVSTITPRTLAVTATGVNKMYDGTTVASVTYSDNRVGGDVLTVSGTATFNNRNVGTGKAVSVTGITLSGTDALNYTQNTTTSTTADITVRPITVTAVTNTKVYDATTSATGIPTVSVNTIAAGDTAAFSETYNNKNVGTGKTLTPAGTVNDGNSGANYIITFANNTTGVITAKALTITAVASNKVYDGNDVATVVLSNDKIGSDNIIVTDTGATFSDKNVGTAKTVTSHFTVGGIDAGNYTFSITASTTANITPKALTISATAQNKFYTGTTPASVTLTNNVLVGDVVTQTYLSADFIDALVGTGKTVTVLGITTAGADAGNYTANTTATTTADITEVPSSGGGGGGGGVFVPLVVKQSNGTVLGAEKFNFTVNMKVGSKGNEVMELQKFLNANGFGPLVVDGKFGKTTKAAVIKFQLANGLKGDGSVGPLTRAILNK